MSLYRCASCGSPNVVADTQVGKTEYDFVKGAVGTVVLGAGGAVAGIGNETQRVFKCPDCGLTLTYPMNDEMKTIIDCGVTSTAFRKNITYMGAPVTWDIIVGMYKNIENSSAGRQIKSDGQVEKDNDENYIKVLAQKIKERLQTSDTVSAEKSEDLTYWEELKETYRKNSADYNNTVKYMLLQISECGEALTKAQYKCLLGECFGEEVPEARISALLRELVADGVLVRSDGNAFCIYAPFSAKPQKDKSEGAELPKDDNKDRVVPKSEEKSEQEVLEEKQKAVEAEIRLQEEKRKAAEAERMAREEAWKAAEAEALAKAEACKAAEAESKLAKEKAELAREQRLAKEREEAQHRKEENRKRAEQAKEQIKDASQKVGKTAVKVGKTSGKIGLAILAVVFFAAAALLAISKFAFRAIEGFGVVVAIVILAAVGAVLLKLSKTPKK